MAGADGRQLCRRRAQLETTPPKTNIPLARARRQPRKKTRWDSGLVPEIRTGRPTDRQAQRVLAAEGSNGGRMVARPASTQPTEGKQRGQTWPMARDPVKFWPLTLLTTTNQKLGHGANAAAPVDNEERLVL
jgi:hypothetical protein